MYVILSKLGTLADIVCIKHNQSVCVCLICECIDMFDKITVVHYCKVKRMQ